MLRFPLSVIAARIEHVFESTLVVADRWTPAVDPACDEDYSDVDLAQWAAERWAVEAAGLGEVPYAHGCNEGCEDGCTQPYVPDPPAADVALDATGGPDDAPALPAGTALITDAVASLPPAQLAGFLAGVPDLAGVDGWSVIEVMKGYEKIARWAAAGQLAAVAEIAHRYPDPQAGWARDAVPPTGLAGLPAPCAAVAASGPTFDQASAQVAFALDLPRASAQGLLVDAVALTDRLPKVVDRLAQGTISTRVARVLAQDTTVCADPATAARVAEHVLARPGLRTGPQVRRATVAAVIAADPAAAERREHAAHAGRSFRPVKDTTDGMTTWDVCLPVAQSYEIDRRLNALAKAATSADDPRSRDAVRADVAATLLLGQPVTAPDGTVLTPANLPTRVAWRADVVVAADTLAGGDQPGHIPGWGPVTAPTARRLATGCPPPRHSHTDRGLGSGVDNDSDSNNDAVGVGVGDSNRVCDSDSVSGSGVIGVGAGGSLASSLAGDPQWRRLVTDPRSGIVLDYGTTRYRPPAALADYVRARDRSCYEPGCTIPAAACDQDPPRNPHAHPSPPPDPGGATADWNLGAGCRTAHRIKAMPGWHVTSPSPGTYTWTTPTGHTYTRPIQPPLPPPLPPALGPTDRLTAGDRAAAHRTRPDPSRSPSPTGPLGPPPY
jgi:hypothetical protein